MGEGGVGWGQWGHPQEGRDGEMDGERKERKKEHDKGCPPSCRTPRPCMATGYPRAQHLWAEPCVLVTSRAAPMRPTTSGAIPLCPHHVQSSPCVSPSPPEQCLCALVTSRAMPLCPQHSPFSPLHETRVKVSGSSFPARVPAAAAAVQQRDLPTELNLADSFAKKKPIKSKMGQASRVPSPLEGQYLFILICSFIFRGDKTQKPAQKMSFEPERKWLKISLR